MFALRNFFRIPRNWKNPIRAIQEFWKSTKKEYKTYYLVVASILVLTLANQSIMQYALAKQRDAALLVNISGRQRSLSQHVARRETRSEQSTNQERPRTTTRRTIEL